MSANTSARHHQPNRATHTHRHRTHLPLHGEVLVVVQLLVAVAEELPRPPHRLHHLHVTHVGVCVYRVRWHVEEVGRHGVHTCWSKTCWPVCAWCRQCAHRAVSVGGGNPWCAQYDTRGKGTAVSDQWCDAL